MKRRPRGATTGLQQLPLPGPDTSTITRTMSNAQDTETSQLLGQPQDDALGATRQSNVICSRICDLAHVQDHVLNDRYCSRILPIAFTAAFAIAATSATTIFAYASIVCVDPAHCREGEKDRYTGVVALATVVANTFGVTAVGVLRQWVESNPKSGLYFWLFCRALGIGSLAVGGEDQYLMCLISAELTKKIDA